MRYDGSESIKNMDDVLLVGQTLEELKQKIEVFVKYCEEKNLKPLKPSKLVISEEVEFAGTVVKSETVQNEEVVSILPRDRRIKAFMDLKNPITKKEVQVMGGILSSLQQWYPSLPLNLSRLRKETAGKGKTI